MGVTVHGAGGFFGSNKNLLDNPWFTVNQRNISSYTVPSSGGYTLDRWYSDGLNTINASNGIAVTFSTGDASVLQKIESDLFERLRGKAVTLSVLLSDGTIKSNSIIVPAAPASATNYCEVVLNANVKAFLRLFPAGSGNHNRVGIAGTSADSSVNLRAVKLELGSVSTLANDAPPNYAEELLKCQRYFVSMKCNGTILCANVPTDSTRIYYPIALSVPLRSVPVVTKIGTFIAYGNITKVLSLGNDISIANNIIKVLFTATGLTATACYYLLGDSSDAELQFSADL